MNKIQRLIQWLYSLILFGSVSFLAGYAGGYYMSVLFIVLATCMGGYLSSKVPYPWQLLIVSAGFAVYGWHGGVILNGKYVAIQDHEILLAITAFILFNLYMYWRRSKMERPLIQATKN